MLENERIDEVNDRLSLIQKTDGLTFGTDALLLAGYIKGRHKRASELGGGSGIISMLLLARDKAEACEAYEVQAEYADLIERNAKLNSLESRLKAIHLDIREIKASESFDLVFSNPPYMKSDSGKQNISDKKSFARHEHHGDIEDFCTAAKKLLKFGGAFYAVYRPDRMIDIIYSMRKNQLEPKRITFVHADEKSEPSMMLIEAKRGGRSGVRITEPFFIYTDKEHRTYTADMQSVMENGAFPEKYAKK